MLCSMRDRDWQVKGEKQGRGRGRWRDKYTYRAMVATTGMWGNGLGLREGGVVEGGEGDVVIGGCVPRSDMGDLKTMQDATMITTLFRVLATLWVTGPGGEEERDGLGNGG